MKIWYKKISKTFRLGILKIFLNQRPMHPAHVNQVSLNQAITLKLAAKVIYAPNKGNPSMAYFHLM